MLNNSHFYHRSIRKIVVAFGTILNDIQIVRFTKDGLTPKEIFKVPLSYGPKEKYLSRLTSDATLPKTVATNVPRISFELTGMSYDTDRKRISTFQNFASNTNSSIKTQYSPVPYNFEFSVSIYVRNMEDGTQIIEQILPFFTPDFTVTVNFIPEMQQKYDLPIILNSVSPEITYEGDFSDTRLILWNLDFTLKGYVWPPIKSGKLITQANTNIHSSVSTVYVNGNYIIQDNFSEQQIVYLDYANGSNYYIETEVIRSGEKYGVVDYFSNTNTGTLIISNSNELFEIGDEIIGDTSHAKYTVTDVSIKSNNPTIQIVTTPDPENAGPDDAYGFNETITEND